MKAEDARVKASPLSMMKRRELEHAEKEQSDFKFDLETKINANQRFQIRKTLKAIVVPVFLAVLMRVSYWMQPKQPERGRLFQEAHLQYANNDKKLDLSELVRYAFFDRDLHSRMPLVPTPACLK
jgi:hypothetical protein